jgi:hypothetical protein
VTTVEPGSFLLFLMLLPLLISLAAYSLARLALTPLAMFGRARLLQAVEESQFVVIPSEARDLFCKMPRKKQIPHSADTVRNDKKRVLPQPVLVLP